MPPTFSVAAFLPDSALIIPQLTVGFVYAVHINSKILSQSMSCNVLAVPEPAEPVARRAHAEAGHGVF